MFVGHNLLKYAFAVLGILVYGLIASCHGFASDITIFYGMGGYLFLASSFFYPAFYGNKWDYLRIILFPLFAGIITFGLVVASDKIRDISGMEGMYLVFLYLEFLYLGPALVLSTTAFCCRMNKRTKILVPWSVFAVHAALNTYFLLTAKPADLNSIVIFLGCIALLPLLLLNVIMTVRILAYKNNRD